MMYKDLEKINDEEFKRILARSPRLL